MKLKYWAGMSLLLVLLWARLGLAQDVVPFRTLSWHMGWVVSVAFSPDGRLLASGSESGITLWDVTRRSLLRTFSGHRGSVFSVTFSPDGALLASGSDKIMNLWDVTSGSLLRTFSGHTDWMESVAFSPDGKTLASGSMDNKIKLWDVSTGSVLHTLSGHMGYVWSVAFSPDGKILASGSENHTIKLWDVERGSLISTLSGHSEAVESVAFSPDGKTLASGSGDRKIKLWDVRSGSCILTISGHTWDVNSVAFSPDGKVLASGAYDKEVKLWDVATGSILQTLSGHTDRVSSVAFSPDGKTLASGSRDGNILLWDVGGILHPNVPPIAKFSTYILSPTGARLIVQPRLGERVWFDASDSSDPDGMITKYEWDWDSDGTFDAISTDPVIGHVFGQPGSHRVTLRVTDDDGDTSNLEKDITIGDFAAPVNQVHVLFDETRLYKRSPGSYDEGSGYEMAINETASYGASQFTQLLRDRDYKVDSVRDQSITPELLEGVKVLLIPGPTLASQYLASEIEAIRKFVELGGGLFLADRNWKGGEKPSGGADPIARAFGVSLKGNGEIDSPRSWGSLYKVKIFNLHDHPVTQGVDSYVFQGNYLDKLGEAAVLAESDSDSWFDLYRDDDWGDHTKQPDEENGPFPVLAAMEYGKGRIVFTCDASMMMNAWIDVLDAGKLALNIVDWLATREVPHPNSLPTAQFTTYALSPTGARLLVQPRTRDRIQFDASASSDPDGKIIKYSWDWDANGSYDETATDRVIEHTFSSAGSHRVTLQVTDDKGATGTVTRTISIGAKQPPNASFTFSPASPSILDTVQFTDTSTDSDGQVVKWEWEFGDGTSSTTANPTHKHAQKKTYTVKLTVTDDDGLTDTATKQLTVINLAPMAALTFSPQEPYMNQPVSFDASDSTDKDGTITNYAWDFNGGGKTDAQGEKAAWTFAKEGTYTVKLTVTDDDGAVASHEQEITINATPPGPPKFENLWGLVVGIQKYQDQWINDHFPVTYTEDDAQAFYDFITDSQGGGFPKDHVHLLLGKDATLIGMRKGLDWLSTVAGADDLVVFYFAGHGTVVPDKNHDEAKVDPKDNQDECLVPYDADWSSLAATTLVDDAIGYWFSNLSSQHVLMVFDSCFSGGASRGARTFSKSGSRAAANNQVFTDMAGAGRLFLAASQADQSSYEYSELGHGVFTYFLLRGLGNKNLPEVSGLPPITKPEGDKDGDGTVTVEEMEEYLDEKVPPYVRQHEGGGEQNPVIRGDENLRNIRLDGYGIPIQGEVSSIAEGKVIVTLGSRQGISVGDELQVIRIYTLADGSTMREVRATLQVEQILGPDRAYCKVVHQDFPIVVHDAVVIAN